MWYGRYREDVIEGGRVRRVFQALTRIWNSFNAPRCEHLISILSPSFWSLLGNTVEGFPHFLQFAVHTSFI